MPDEPFTTAAGFDEQMEREQARRIGPMAHATVALLGMMGLRIHEACGLDVTSVTLAGGWEVIRFIGKGNKGAEMPLPVPVLRAVHAAIGDRTDGPLLLNQWGNRMTRPNATALLHRAARMADVHKHISPHSLRRTFVTSGLLNGVSLREMQIAARHAEPGMTVRYDMMVGGHERHAAHRVAGYLASMSGKADTPTSVRCGAGAATLSGPRATVT